MKCTSTKQDSWLRLTHFCTQVISGELQGAATEADSMFRQTDKHLYELFSFKLGSAVSIDRMTQVSLTPIGFAAIIHLHMLLV